MLYVLPCAASPSISGLRKFDSRLELKNAIAI